MCGTARLALLPGSKLCLPLSSNFAVFNINTHCNTAFVTPVYISAFLVFILQIVRCFLILYVLGARMEIPMSLMMWWSSPLTFISFLIGVVRHEYSGTTGGRRSAPWYSANS
ncbi:uncharacterized protein C8Q71DRAFT_45772 [Rhodofomes roseus]|uniref:Uncharacterized protein n=1 Tax=Rhodofomes roseus TaxID=34475 RepID=A0ABQ8KFE6_9APHY|nr:uncharacterized protein C8Q71DRAFT_45772 [Rhodofomes roseus]KAH9836506.1 hypothetical protein C8Q71DRAFT_45772 [Rhodofomes roseus]